MSMYVYNIISGSPVFLSYVHFACMHLYVTYIHYSDLIEGMILLMQSNYTDPVNLGNPEEYTILEFAETILERVGQHLMQNKLHIYIHVCMYHTLDMLMNVLGI